MNVEYDRDKSISLKSSDETVLGAKANPEEITYEDGKKIKDMHYMNIKRGDCLRKLSKGNIIKLSIGTRYKEKFREFPYIIKNRKKL